MWNQLLLLSLFAIFAHHTAAVHWWVDAPCLLPGVLSGGQDSVSVKDPSIVFVNGQYHVFFTVKDSCCWRMAYVTAPTIAGLQSAPRIFLSALKGGDYFCAPEVFFYPAQNKWYLIYQNQGATFSTNTDISNPNGWTAGKPMGFGDGLDFWVVFDNSTSNVYAFYSGQDQTIRTRSTTRSAFPYGWGAASKAVDAFEGVHVYHSLADGKYYMMVEDLYRWFHLHKADSLAGPWTLVENQWASSNQLTFNPGVSAWATQVSHGEIFRASNNEFLEIGDINHVDVLMQSVGSGSWEYGDIPYRLGVMHNYQSAVPTCSTPANPANGHFTCSAGVCTLICDSGYAPTGTGFSTCVNGAWNTLATCVSSGASGSNACGLSNEGSVMSISCATGQVVTAVEFASYGKPQGSCTSSSISTSCHALSSLAVLQDACVGKANCSVNAANSVFSDPCSGTAKQLAVRAHCAVATSVCASASEWGTLTLTCPDSKTVAGISFASYGTATGSCGSFAKSSCHATSSLDLVQKACVGRTSCAFAAPMNSIFGDPCSGIGKALNIQALCM